MPQPTSQDVHIDEVLTDLAVAFIQDTRLYIATKVFPIVSVAKQSNKYIIWTKNDWFRDEAQKRADATESAGSGFNLSTDSYFADVWAFHKDVGSQARRNQDSGVNLERATVNFVTQRMLLRQELQWVTDFFTTGIWATDYTVAAVWDNYATSDPIEDFESQKEVMASTTGFLPNTAVFGYSAMRRLKSHPDIVERIKYTGSGARNVTEATVAEILGLDNVYVARAIKATNIEAETAAYSFTHGKHAWLGYVNPNPAFESPSAGLTFAWDYAGYGASVNIDQFELRKTKSVRYEAEAAWDNKVIASDLGIFMPNVVT